MNAMDAALSVASTSSTTAFVMGDVGAGLTRLHFGPSSSSSASKYDSSAFASPNFRCGSVSCVVLR
jgi:hypothetical protein